jgi:DoxX.
MAAVFMVGGAMKLLGSAPMVQLFADIGLGQWLRYLVGLLELMGGSAMLVSGLAGAAALGLTVLMVGAVMAQLLILRRLPLASGACAVALMIIVWGSREEARSLLERFSRK